MTTLRITCDQVSESLLVRCDLSRSESPIQVDYLVGNGGEGSQWQCADARHTRDGLASIGSQLLGEALGECDGEFATDYEEVVSG